MNQNILNATGRTRRFAKTFALAVCAILISGANGLFAQLGALDPNFATNGVYSAAIGNIRPTTKAVAYTADGKILVGSSPVFSAGLGFGTGNVFAITRLNANGTVDPSFGNFPGSTSPSPGVVATSINAGKSGLTRLRVLSNGKILAGGTHFAGSNTFMVLARYEANGQLDLTFGQNGIASIGTFVSGVDFIVQPSGKIVFTGYTDQGMIAIRFNADGSVDNSFGMLGNGTFFTNNFTFSTDIEAQSDGKLVYAAYSSSSPIGGYLIRTTADGVLDPTFGSNGVAFTPLNTLDAGFAGAAPNHVIEIQSDNKIVSAIEMLYTPDGQNLYYRPVVYRHSVNGTIDPTFGTNGFFASTQPSLLENGLNQSNFNCLEVQKNDKVVFAQGYLANIFVQNNPPKGFRVTRLTSNGALDTGFGSSGQFIQALAGATDTIQPNVLSIQDNGQIIVGGDLANNNYLVRINGDLTSNGILSFATGTPSAAVNEGSAGLTNYNFTVNLAGATAFPVSVDVLFTGNAVYGIPTSTDPLRDYTTSPALTSGKITLTFTSNSSQNVTVRVQGNTLAEANDVVDMMLANNSNNSAIDPSQNSRSLTITNDDGSATVEFSTSTPSKSVAEGNSGTTDQIFDIRLANAGSFPVTIYLGVSGSADNPSDYYTNPAGSFGTVPFTFSANGTKQFIIKLKGDLISENDENVLVQMQSAPSFVTIGSENNRLLTITNDEAPLVDCSVVPSGLNETNLMDNSATLNWTGSANASSYEIRYITTGQTGINDYVNLTTTAPTTSVNTNALIQNTSYKWQVRAVCGSGVFSAWSAFKTFTTTGAPLPCPTPGNMTESNVTGTSATLNWDASTNAAYYNLSWKLSSAGSYANQFTTTPNSYTISGLTPSTSYDWRVRARCGNPISNWSVDKTFVTAGARFGGSQNPASDFAVVLYPNPNNGQFSVDFVNALEGKATIRIIDFTGRVVKNDVVESVSGANSFNIALEGQSAGLYLLEIEHADQLVRTKFVVK